MNEKTFWSNKLRPVVAAHGWVERVENSVSPGTPDVDYVLRNRDQRVVAGKIELKYRATVPVRMSTRVFTPNNGLRRAQIAWWVPFLRAGGHGALVVGIGGGVWAWRATEQLVRRFNDMTWADYSYSGPVDVDMLLEVLRG